MFISTKEEQSSDWKGFTLVIPAVSVGNVGQLAADLIISTLSMHPVGHFHDDSFLPVIGNDPFAIGEAGKSCKLVTAAQVYASATHRLIVVQQRSPLIKGKKGQYVDKIMEWIKEQQFAKILILTSTFAHERTDKQLTGTQHRFVFSPSLDAEAGSMVRETLHWVALEERSSGASTEVATSGELYIPGSGMAKGLYQRCLQEKVPVAILLAFVSEGDNTSDAVQLATYINSWQGWTDIKKETEKKYGFISGWKIPSSWRLLFGSDFEQILYQ